MPSLTMLSRTPRKPLAGGTMPPLGAGGIVNVVGEEKVVRAVGEEECMG